MELKDRGKALEEQFFQKEEHRKLEALREKKEREERKDALRAASGMDDDGVLERLVDIGITTATLSAVSLVPLVEVAWADRNLDEREKNAILHGARGKGIEEGSAAYGMLEGWLSKRPGPELFEAWSSYIDALDKELTGAQLEILERQVVDRARGVAESAGGFLYGTFGRVSTEEKAALERIAAVFARRGASAE